MIYGCYTILTKLEPVYKVHLPKSVSYYLKLFAVAVGFGLDVAFGAPLQCLGWGGYQSSLEFWMALPVVIIGLIGVYVAATAARTRARQRRRRAKEAEQLAAAQAAASRAATEAWMAAPEGLRAQYKSLLEAQQSAGAERLELEEAELVEMRALFHQYDADGSGLLDRAEFEAMMAGVGEATGKHHARSQLRALFKWADKDKSGLIDFREFVLMQQSWRERVQRCRSGSAQPEAAPSGGEGSTGAGGGGTGGNPEKPTGADAEETSVLMRWLAHVITVLFLFFPHVTETAFMSFSCYNFTARPASDGVAGEYEYYLMADTSVACDDLSTNPTNSTAWLAVALYPIGVLVFTAFLLFRAKQAIVDGPPTPLSKALAFLHKDLKPTFFFWELAEMARRLVLVGFMGRVEPGSVMQLVIAMVFSLLFMVIQLQSSPFKEQSDGCEHAHTRTRTRTHAHTRTHMRTRVGAR